MKTDKMQQFFSGEQLYGDSFSLEEIEQWYKEEEEAYANMYGDDVSPDNFEYTNMDTLYGFKPLPNKIYKNALGFGASWGYEFLPIIDRIENLTIIESSDKTISKQLGNVKPNYIKASVSGKIDLPNDTFDLITCFSCLHHIPNVSYVISELFRILQNGGFLLLREPITSMGDWRMDRKGLTKNERGIPRFYIKKIIENLNATMVKESYHYFIHPFLMRKLHYPKFLNSRWYLKIDHFLSNVFLWNYHYHPTNKLQRISPSYVYYVIMK